MAIHHRPSLLVGLLLALRLAARAAGDERALSEESASLERAVDQAVAQGRFGRAAALLRGLETLVAPSPAPAFRLGEVYAMAGQYDQAIEAYRRYAASGNAEPDKKTRAEEEATRLAEAPAPFSDAPFRAERATDEAKRLFTLGLKAQNKKGGSENDRAARLLEASLRLDPELPGPYRVLGVIYGRLGDRGRETRFLTDYLRMRPDGAIADAVRKKLAAEKVLGKLSLDSSFPCDVLVDGRRTGRETPIKEMTLPAGRYTVTLVNDKYHIARNLHVDVGPGEVIAKSFSFGVLRTKLAPWARVRVDGKDVGLWDEVGVPEGKHTVAYRAFDNSHEKSVDLTIAAGGHEALTW
jgi:tetratricopeptide (TPR) repeat protein